MFPNVFFTLQGVQSALFSLLHLYPRRNLSAEQWRAQEMLSLVSKPAVLLNPAQSETVSIVYRVIL